MKETKTIVKCNRCKREIDGQCIMIQWLGGLEGHICENCAGAFNEWVDMTLADEYPLTFEQALRTMLDGKIVEPDYDGGLHHRFNKDHGCLEFYSKAEGAWNRCGLGVSEQEAKWKVVE